LSHVRNRDILTATIAATIALAISFIAQIGQFAMFFGNFGGRDDNEGENVITLLLDRKSTRLNSSHGSNSYADFCLKKKSPATSESLRRSKSARIKDLVADLLPA